MGGLLLYYDRAVAVCDKPVGVLSELGSARNLPDLAAAALAERGEAGELRTVHRLDKAVGGLCVLARTGEAAGKLIAQIADRSAQKEYFAVLRGRPEADAAELEDLLFHDSRVNKTYVVRRPRKGVRTAKLSYRVLDSTERDGQALTLVRVRLHTGRTHQIRAQFSARGLPLLGDVRYGSRDPRCEVSLRACYLRFLHPETGKPMEFFLPPPREYPWDLFDAAVYEP